jgi:hypothetical protein
MRFCESEAELAARSRAMTARMAEHTEAMDAKPLPSRLAWCGTRRFLLVPEISYPNATHF